VNKYGDNVKKNKQAVIDFVLYMMKPDVHEITASTELPAFKSTYADAAFMAKLYKNNPMSQLRAPGGNGARPASSRPGTARST